MRAITSVNSICYPADVFYVYFHHHPHHGNGASGHPLSIVKYFEKEVLCKCSFYCIYNECDRTDGNISEACEHHRQGRGIHKSSNKLVLILQAQMNF